jgi:hypothetical protein
MIAGMRAALAGFDLLGIADSKKKTQQQTLNSTGETKSPRLNLGMTSSTVRKSSKVTLTLMMVLPADRRDSVSLRTTMKEPLTLLKRTMAVKKVRMTLTRAESLRNVA